MSTTTTAAPTSTALVTPKKAAADRLHQVTTWILSGASEHEINEAIAKNWPTVKARPVIVQAMARISREGDGDPGEVKAWAVEATKLLYKQALAAGDFATALRAVKQIVELSEEG
jgi:hypothetical protein